MRHFFLLFFFFLSFWAQGQELLWSIPQKSSLIRLDHLQQLYIVSADGKKIDKYDGEGQKLYSFSQNNQGAIQELDVSNPFQPLIFFSDFQEVLLLDRRLGQMQSLDLNDWDLLQVDALSGSSDQKIWLFDAIDFQLKKMGPDGQVLIETAELWSILRDDFLPSRLWESQDKLAVWEEGNALYLFDLFGNFLRKIPLPDAQSLQLTGPYLSWLDHQQHWQRIHLQSFQQRKIDLKKSGIPTEGLKSLRYQAYRLYLAYENEIRVYRWEE